MPLNILFSPIAKGAGIENTPNFTAYLNQNIIAQILARFVTTSTQMMPVLLPKNIICEIFGTDSDYKSPRLLIAQLRTDESSLLLSFIETLLEELLTLSLFNCIIIFLAETHCHLRI